MYECMMIDDYREELIFSYSIDYSDFVYIVDIYDDI